MKPSLTRRTVITARAVAVVADALQLGLLPLFAPGVLSPFDGVLDVLVAAFMIWRLGWHAAFLPTFVTELIPFVDMFPTWTLAVWWVTRGKTPPRS